MSLKRKIFADSNINLGRQKELDLARAFVIFCLGFIHVTIECTSDEGLSKGIPYFFDTIIGGPFSAPMYMFIMGVGMVYTSKNTSHQFFQRGIKLLGVGYALNVCRFLVPYLIGFYITGDLDAYIKPLVYKVLENDILIFAGIAMMGIAFFKKIKLSTVAMVVAALAMCIMGNFLNGVNVGSPAGNIFLGYLVGTEDKAGLVASYFPLLNWMIFPVCGYAFGTALKRVKDKKLFYLAFSLPAIIVAVVYFCWGISNRVGMFGEGQNCYYHINFFDVAASLALTIGTIGIYYAISCILPKKIENIAVGISVNITEVYFIHWIIVSFVCKVTFHAVRGTTLLTSWQLVGVGFVVSVVSIVLADYYRKLTGCGK